MERIEGIIRHFIFRNDLNGFSVFSVETGEGGSGIIKAAGCLTGVSIGDQVVLLGWWKIHPRFGKQFNFSDFRLVLPTSSSEIESYLASGAVKGVGPGLAKRIVERFGDKTLEVLDKHADRIIEVEGIGRIKSTVIINSWLKKRESRDILLFLQSHGLTPAFARKVYLKYGQGSIGQVRENPYGLIRAISGIGFITADRLARGLGIEIDDTRRINAGLLHVMRKSEDNGHVYLPIGRLTANGTELLEISSEDVEGEILNLVETGDLEREDERIYLPRLLAMEKESVELFRGLREADPILPLAPRRVEEVIKEALDTGLFLSEEQASALRTLLSGSVAVLTGGPGTGKTTITRWISRILLLHTSNIALAAPTGRAAKRLAESCRTSAKTIHRLLRFDPESRQFQYNTEEPLEVDAILIDEMSMVDLHLFHALLCALRRGTRLILIGDSDQLPSVGAGNVFRDIIESGTVPVSRLSKVYRQSDRSSIVTNAHHIRSGRMPVLSGNDDFFFIENPDPEECSRIMVELVSERLPARYGFDPRKEIQVITPMYRGAVGADNLNALLQKSLNPDEQGRGNGQSSLKFAPGDKVMQLKNNYRKGVFNGDIGFIHSVTDNPSALLVSFDTGFVEYPPDEMDHLTLAYAITVHKSQGSEFPAVILPLTTQHYIMLQRNLLYTALTRTKKIVVLVGTKKALAIAIRNDKIRERFTSLKDRLLRFCST